MYDTKALQHFSSPHKEHRTSQNVAGLARQLFPYLSGPSGAAMMSSSPTVRASSPSTRHRFRVHGTGSSSSPLLNTTIFVFSIATNYVQTEQKEKQ